MGKLYNPGTIASIRQFIEQENDDKRTGFRVLGRGKGRYSEEQKEYAIGQVQENGVRATARVLELARKTLQRWLKAQGITVRRCPAWVYDWAYWRRKRREKWERIRTRRGH
jgi:transposase-like protein